MSIWEYIMKVEDFSYDLPEELIAQIPLPERSASKLLIVDRKSGRLTDAHFFNLPDYLNSQDLLVFNDTKVLPARLRGIKSATGAVIEVLLLKERPSGWEALVRPARRIIPGSVINFGNVMQGEIIEKGSDGVCLIRFAYRGVFLEILEELGEIPLPPYIHNKIPDDGRYQTIYAACPGSAAAPTAGLHFDDEVFRNINDKGVGSCYVTLHVGLATFRPVTEENVEEHQMHTEYYEIHRQAASALNEARRAGRRIIAVGTTSARVLEAAFTAEGFVPGKNETDIFIYPGYTFRAVDALITNFHLPKSTLLMLVSAFYERQKILEAYRHAIGRHYRFFSFGDAMFII